MLNQFQYNTCFYLSMYLYCVHQYSCNFNTTLVFIYHRNLARKHSEILISIQHLFLFIAIIQSIRDCREKFQYNTCFYLSAGATSLRWNLCISIQHLFLFIAAQSNERVYGNSISIQHLFLFIDPTKKIMTGSYKFQYNTCFYLSSGNPIWRWGKQISIQHLFLFISTKRHRKTILFLISIQHLFLFIFLYPLTYNSVKAISIQHLFLFIGFMQQKKGQ